MNLNNTKISAVVLAKNEEENITACLESVKWCNEIFVIDDRSIDKTTEVAKRYGAKIVEHVLNNDFATQRNFGLQQVKNDWILFVDADEVISNALVFEIQNIIIQPFNTYNGFYIKRRDYLWGRELNHGEVSNIKLLRLGKKGKGEWIGKVHERWNIEGLVGELQNSMKHSPHKTISEFFQEINFYSTIRSKELFEKSVKANFIDITTFPLTKFLLNYIVRGGFLDGIRGLILAIMMSFHSFLVRSKLFLLWQKNK